MPRLPLIDLQEAWAAVDYIARCGGFRSQRSAELVKWRIGREARRRWGLRARRVAFAGGRGEGGSTRG